MKVTLKTGVTYPRGSGPLNEVGAVLDVPDDTAADWIKRGIAEAAREWDGSESGESPPVVRKQAAKPHKGKK